MRYRVTHLCENDSLDPSWKVGIPPHNPSLGQLRHDIQRCHPLPCSWARPNRGTFSFNYYHHVLKSSIIQRWIRYIEVSMFDGSMQWIIQVHISKTENYIPIQSILRWDFGFRYPDIRCSDIPGVIYRNFRYNIQTYRSWSHMRSSSTRKDHGGVEFNNSHHIKSCNAFNITRWIEVPMFFILT